MKQETENRNISVFSVIVIVVVLVALISVFISEREKNYSDKQVFTNIYEKNLWGGGSGQGSKVENAGPFLDYLQSFIDTQEISTIVDIGCGDWELMKTIRIPDYIKYLGLDIVDHIVAENQKKYARNNVKFETVDDIKNLAAYKGDLLIIKDVLQHWENNKIIYAINNIVPNFKYAIIVNGINLPGFDYNKNLDTRVGDMHILNLEEAPFSMKNLQIIMDYDLVTFKERKRIYLYVRDKSDPLFK